LFRPFFINIAGVVIKKMRAYGRNPDQVIDRIKCPAPCPVILQTFFCGVAVLEYYPPATCPAFFAFHIIYSDQINLIKILAL
jgi:hypothetical protein